MTKNNKKGTSKPIVKKAIVKKSTPKVDKAEPFDINEYPEFNEFIMNASEEIIEPIPLKEILTPEKEIEVFAENIISVTEEEIPEIGTEVISEYSAFIESEVPVNEIPEIIKLPEEQLKKRTIESLTRGELRIYQRTGILPQ